jgi:large subunit ribosomal protein L35
VFLQLIINMPKVKTNSSAKKRFKVTGSGKVLHKQAGKRHNLGKKSQKRIRNLRKSATLSEGHAKSLLIYKMPNSK